MPGTVVLPPVEDQPWPKACRLSPHCDTCGCCWWRRGKQGFGTLQPGARGITELPER